jgi:putative hydrolase of HD superfamily
MFDSLRLLRQVEFIVEIDKLKQVLRQTFTNTKSRQENSAEHSWHIALMAILLFEYSDSNKIDVFRVVKMLLVHDLVEIDAGDTFCYDNDARKNQHERELQAAERIFNIAPKDQAKTLMTLWKEFEACKTPDSRFANAIDRLQPLLSNYYSNGKAWIKHNIKRHQVLERNCIIEKEAPKLWDYVKELIDDAVQRGFLKK